MPICKSSILLPITVAEGVLGRLSPQKVLLSIPAQVLGCVTAVIMFRSTIPFIPDVVCIIGAVIMEMNCV